MSTSNVTAAGTELSDPTTAAAAAGPSVAAKPSWVARCGAELLGTFVLVFGGCGTAVLAATARTPTDTEVGVGYLGVALAFGLAVLVMAAAFGPVSGGHFNPAVTVAAVITGRLHPRWAAPYLAAQVVGASAAAALLFVVAAGRAGFDPVGSGFASNGYGARSPQGYSLLSAMVVEVICTAIFVAVILAVTDPARPLSWGPVAIGLTLTLVHLVAIPVTNTSVNPARSLGVAWFAGPAALGQVWLFLAAPLLGAVIAALGHRGVGRARRV